LLDLTLFCLQPQAFIHFFGQSNKNVKMLKETFKM